MSQPVQLHAAYFTLNGERPLGGAEVSRYDLRARAEACARVGYTGIGVAYTDLQASIAKFGHAGIRSILRDNDIRTFEVEPLFNWFGDEATLPENKAAHIAMLSDAEKCGARHVKAVGALGPHNASVETMRRDFERLCKLGESYEVLVLIEMICISNIRDLRAAAAIVGDTWQRNGGLALDIWHFARGGVPYQDIAGIPAGSIRWVELDDGDAEQKGDMLDEQIDHRRLCGKGGFDIPGFLQALNAAGYHGPYGVEIISEELRALPLDTVARLTFDSAAQYFNRKAA